jgi:hypothetical protein
MAGQAVSKTLTGNIETEIWIVKPVSNSSREIRDAILRENFGYTEEDIKALDREKPGYFYISDSSDTKNWATVNHIRDWKTNVNGEVPISMPQALIENLVLFREQRADFEIFKVGMFIANAEIRGRFIEDLKKIINSSGEKRIEALNNLMNTIAGSGAARGEIYRALRFLTNESGYKNNPFLMLAFAQTTIYQSDVPSMGSSQVGQGQIANVIKLTNESLYNPQTKSSLTKISKAEAAAINSFASNLYSQSNADAEANNRRWIERFLKMKPEEKDLYEDGDLISLSAPNETVLRAPTHLELKRQNLIKDHNETVDQWAKSDNIGAPQPVKTDHRTSELFQNPNDTYEKEGWEKKKNRGTNKGNQPKIVPTLKPNTYNPYSSANVRADGYGAIFALYLEAAKYQKFAARMAVITNYLNKKDRLERAIRNERVRLKPPPPEVTLAHIKEFQRYGRITANPFEKRQIGVTLGHLQRLLEEGYAYYR